MFQHPFTIKKYFILYKSGTFLYSCRQLGFSSGFSGYFASFILVWSTEDWKVGCLEFWLVLRDSLGHYLQTIPSFNTSRFDSTLICTHSATCPCRQEHLLLHCCRHRSFTYRFKLLSDMREPAFKVLYQHWGLLASFSFSICCLSASLVKLVKRLPFPCEKDFVAPPEIRRKVVYGSNN